jgi:hypothetical protein
MTAVIAVAIAGTSLASVWVVAALEHPSRAECPVASEPEAGVGRHGRLTEQIQR